MPLVLVQRLVPLLACLYIDRYQPESTESQGCSSQLPLAQERGLVLVLLVPRLLVLEPRPFFVEQALQTVSVLLSGLALFF